MDIYDEIKKELIKKDIVNIVIAGATCSGKTTLSKNILKYFEDEHSVSIFEQDAYFKDLSDIPRVREGYLTDSIYAFHVDEMKEDVQTFLTCGKVCIPRYQVATNTRISKNKIITLGKINIFEGLHTINLLYSLSGGIKIFLDTDIEECLRRRIERDTSLYGIPELRIREYFNDCIIPMYNKFILPQRDFADVVIK